MTRDVIEHWMTERIAATLARDPDDFDPSLPLTSHGLDSLALLNLTGDLAEYLGRDLSTTLTWEYPTIELLARHLAAPVEMDGGPDLLPARRDGPLPLTFSQERIWVHSKPDWDVGFIVEVFSLSGSLNVEALRQSLGEVVRRHENLRTTFRVVDGRPVQVIHPPGADVLELTDLTPEPDPDAAADRLMRLAASEPMNLECGPLVRVRLLRLCGDRHRLVFIVHHILYDAASLSNLYQECSECYAAFLSGGPLPEDGAVVQMADFAVWQREWLHPEGAVYQGHLAWWKNYLAGPIPRALDLSIKWRDAPRASTDAGGRILWEVPRDLREAVRTFALSAGATPHHVFLAVFAVLLHELSGQEEMILGSYVSNRARHSVWRSIGFFANLVTMRVRVRACSTFIEVLGEVQEASRLTSVHQDMPFEELARVLRLEGREVPNIQVIFQYVHGVAPALRLANVEIQRLPVEPPPRRQWGLSLGFLDRPDSLTAQLRFDTSLYDPAAVAGMLDRYQSILRELAHHAPHRFSPPPSADGGMPGPG